MSVKSLGLVSLLATLAIVGWLFATQVKQAGPTSELAESAEANASAGAATANFQAAGPVLQTWLADHGTYAGAALPPVYGVAVMRADATSYCLQAGSGAAVQHQVGPTGPVQPGPC